MHISVLGVCRGMCMQSHASYAEAWSNNLQPFNTLKMGIKQYSGKVLPDRQYHVRIDGSGRITLKNRHHLWQTLNSISNLIPTASPNPINDTTPHQTTNQALSYEKHGRATIAGLITKFRGYRRGKSCTPPHTYMIIPFRTS